MTIALLEAFFRRGALLSLERFAVSLTKLAVSLIDLAILRHHLLTDLLVPLHCPFVRLLMSSVHFLIPPAASGSAFAVQAVAPRAR
ncbi:hypothetical protein [Mycobacterium colombiense]|uniref:Uncharacterized protein n=1 Tax=Mycobacterium colombiense TaxID=339268 RepID=A0A1A2YH84_9MYCO|nr:hypothetical protein [Mycobacterium colombiense]OBI37549.1 hypothetical protein A5708_06460 [Mycobacterium colombiense]